MTDIMGRGFDISGTDPQAGLGAQAPLQFEVPSSDVSVTDEELRREVYNRFPGFSLFLDIPELAALITEAVNSRWSFSELQARLYATEWWQSRSASVRGWIGLESIDPAEAQRRIQQKTLQLANVAAVQGINIGPVRITEIARDSLLYGWTADEERLALSNEAVFGAVSEVGDLAATATDIRGIAGAYFQKVDDAAARDMSLRLFQGKTNLDSIEQVFRTQAKQRFSHLADVIDAGITLADYYAPVIGEAASILEIAPQQIDPTEEQFSWLLEVVDSESGQIRSPTIAEARALARNRPEWQFTDNATQLGTALVDEITNIWGVR